jgi:hypothetical protein
MAQRPLDIFSLLPRPVWVEILVHLEDLAAVYCLYRSSPAAFSLLHEDGTGRRVIEAIMNESVPKRIQILIRKFAFLPMECSACNRHG